MPDAQTPNTVTVKIFDRWNAVVRFTADVDASLSIHARLGAAVQMAFAVNANLISADLRGADLRGANLSGAGLRGADMRDANLSGVPVVPAIDAAIVAAIDESGILDMSDWHKCGTTHCRAGWAITLAGDAGAQLEAKVGSSAAGALIYAASRPDMPVPDFYCDNKTAMDDLRACAAQQGEVA